MARSTACRSPWIPWPLRSSGVARPWSGCVGSMACQRRCSAWCTSGNTRTKEIGRGLDEQPFGQPSALLHALNAARDEPLQSGVIARSRGVDGAGGEGMRPSGAADERREARGRHLEAALQVVVGPPVEHLAAAGDAKERSERHVEHGDGKAALGLCAPERLEVVPGRARQVHGLGAPRPLAEQPMGGRRGAGQERGPHRPAVHGLRSDDRSPDTFPGKVAEARQVAAIQQPAHERGLRGVDADGQHGAAVRDLHRGAWRIAEAEARRHGHCGAVRAGRAARGVSCFTRRPLPGAAPDPGCRAPLRSIVFGAAMWTTAGTRPVLDCEEKAGQGQASAIAPRTQSGGRVG